MPDDTFRFAGEGRLRFFADGALLFAPGTWATHVLNEDAARLARAITGLDVPVPFDRAVAIARDELGWEAEDPAVLQTLRIFVDAQLVHPASG